MPSPWTDVLASSAGTAANHHYRLPPMVPQKIASYCHVKHSRKEMPDLPKETVKSLVQVHLLKASSQGHTLQILTDTHLLVN